MTDTVDALIVDLLEYVVSKERTYEEAIEAWRTSCPKLPVWEEANERGLITRARANGNVIVRITAAGVALLEQHERMPPHDSLPRFGIDDGRVPGRGAGAVDK